MPSPNIIQWETDGRILDVDGSGIPASGSNPVIDHKVDFTEIGNSFYIKDDQSLPIAGIPIDANLAAYLIRKLFKKLKDDEEGLLDLFLNARAITIDKNALAKTISQPGCEGIRFYLGLKPNVGAEEGDPETLLSFVTVGVDKEGKDLNYIFDQNLADLVKDDKYQLETTSLLSEYNYPPPPRKFTEDKDMYVIGTYGWSDLL